jgi:predicted kinase
MEKNKVIKILIGLPASGKSTWSKDFIQRNSNWARVNRDDFRFMLKNSGVCENKVENLITEASEDLIFKCLKNNLNVIVDNTNLKAKYINAFIEKFRPYADIEFMLFDVPAKTCIERDKAREKAVGEGVIEKMNKDFLILKDTFVFQNVIREKEKHFVLKLNPALKNAVIFDIDGTLAFMGNRGPFDWKKVDRDYINPIVAEHVEFHKSKGRKILLFTGRDEICREETEFWLKFYHVYYDELYMRPKDNFQKDSVIKENMYSNIKDKYNILCVYDDRIQVVKKWAELGVYTFCVNQGLIEF